MRDEKQSMQVFPHIDVYEINFVSVAPYDAYSSSKESQLKAYWVMPPPEVRAFTIIYIS